MDGIAATTRDFATVVRVEIQTDEGRRLASRYGIELTPSYVVFDAGGREVRRLSRVGPETADLLRTLVRAVAWKWQH